MRFKGVLACIGLILLAVIVVVLQLQYWANAKIRDRDRSQSLRLGTNIWTGYEPLFLARHLGYYDEHWVRLVEYSSASQVMRAFRNNDIEVAALTLDEVLLLKENGYDVRVILVTDISHGGDVILGNSEIAELTDLRGRNVGVENTALGAYVLMRALQGVGMSVADVNVVPLEVDEHARAFTDGSVEAVVTFDPVRSRLIAKGARPLFDSTQIPGEIVDVLAVRGSTIENNGEELSMLLRGWFSALQYLREHPDDASKQMTRRLRLEPSDVLASLAGLQLPELDQNVALLSGTRPKLVETAERLADLMLEQQLLQNKIDVSQLFSADPLETVNDQ